MTSKVAVVTGGNKGIGYAIVKGLCEQFDGVVYLTARDEKRGTDAVRELEALGLKPKFHQLDITDKSSIIKFRDYIKDRYGGLDVLVNNAAVGSKPTENNPFSAQAPDIIRINYFSLVAVCHELFPLLRPHGRVVNMSSAAGRLTYVTSESLRQQLLNPDMTEEQLSALMKEYLELAKQGKHEQHGWHSNPYYTSKAACCKLTFMQQSEFDKDSREDLVVNVVHPGFVDTDMVKHVPWEYRQHAVNIDQGAVAPIYLALLPPNVKEPRGQFIWSDKSILGWNEPMP